MYDLPAKVKFFSICENWLASEKGDGKIERNLNFVSQNEFKKLKRQNESVMDKCSDLHLWYSVFNKPIGSLFSLLNRVTCCFLSFYLSMLLITVFYTSSNVNSKDSISLNLSIFNLNKQQVSNLN